MSRILLIFALTLAAIASQKVCAQTVGDSLIVNFKNDQRVAVPIADIQKITFDSVTSSVEGEESSQTNFEVAEPYPNPVRQNTTLEFTTAKAGNVTIAIYDAKGNRVRSIEIRN